MQSESTKAREALDTMLREHDELAACLAQDETLTQGLTNQLEEIKAKLLERQHARDATIKQKQKLSKAITRQREELSSIQASFDNRLKEVRDHRGQRYSSISRTLPRCRDVRIPFLLALCSISFSRMTTVQARRFDGWVTLSVKYNAGFSFDTDRNS
jgi:septal ring factor EnvC (AmiA/AmiB activator)